MRAKDLHDAGQPPTKDQDTAMAGAPRADHRLADNPGAPGRTAVEEPGPGDVHNQPTPEEFGERGMGMAAKE